MSRSPKVKSLSQVHADEIINDWPSCKFGWTPSQVSTHYFPPKPHSHCHTASLQAGAVGAAASSEVEGVADDERRIGASAKRPRAPPARLKPLDGLAAAPAGSPTASPSIPRSCLKMSWYAKVSPLTRVLEMRACPSASSVTLSRKVTSCTWALTKK